MSAFCALEDVVPEILGEGVVTRILRGERMTLVFVELDPGSPVPEHAHDNEQIGVLVSGSMEFRIGGELREIRAGDAWTIPAGVPHAVDRAGPDGAALIEAFAPARVDWDGLERIAPRKLRRPIEGMADGPRA
ncbi:MAG: cupin protein [Conexibacter sp.]|nr:cupin protein [Conexibacter sp.]